MNKENIINLFLNSCPIIGVDCLKNILKFLIMILLYEVLFLTIYYTW